MANSNTITISNLDFVNLRASLISFLQQQSIFTDYNFEGSGLATILDLLAFNAYSDAFLANAVVNESFLATAKQRNSVVKIAQQLGYLPASVKPASASINLCCVVPNTYSGASLVGSTITVPQGFSMTATGADGGTYNFSTTTTTTLSFVSTIGSKGGFVNAIPIEIREGTAKTFSYVYDATLTSDPILLPDQNIDLLSISVSEMQDTTSNTVLNSYTLADDVTTVSDTSTVFWIEEAQNQQYVIRFGDGILGSPPAQNAIILVSYNVTSGSLANGIGQQNILAFNNGVQSLSNTSVAVTPTPTVAVTNGKITGYASGGAERESIDSIKFNAPKSYQAQNRCVTANDYSIVITENAPFTVESISVFGGETLVPPQLGKVFVSIKPAGADTMNPTQLADVQEIVATKAMVGIEPIFVDPSYTYLALHINAFYDPSQLSGTESDLTNTITSAINEYATDNLQHFGKIFKYSNFLNTIQESDVSITRASLSITMYEKLTTPLSTSSATAYVLNFNNAFFHENVDDRPISSDPFTYMAKAGCTFKDDGNGRLMIVDASGSTVDSSKGTVDYDAGVITVGIPGNLFSVNVTDLRIFAIPSNGGVADIYTNAEQILEVENSGISVTVAKEQYS